MVIFGFIAKSYGAYIWTLNNNLLLSGLYFLSSGNSKGELTVASYPAERAVTKINLFALFPPVSLMAL